MTTVLPSQFQGRLQKCQELYVEGMLKLIQNLSDHQGHGNIDVVLEAICSAEETRIQTKIQKFDQIFEDFARTRASFTSKLNDLEQIIQGVDKNLRVMQLFNDSDELVKAVGESVLLRIKDEVLLSRSRPTGDIDVYL